MAAIHSYDPPERFVVGTVGEPGQRAFYLQARSGTRLTTVAVEKQQVVALAERIDELLDELLTQSGNEALIPAVTPFDLRDDAPLEQPLAEDFRGGTMTLSWDTASDQVVVEVFSFTPGEGIEAEEEPEEALVVRLAPGPARAFVERARVVVEAGRPDCPFCGLPLDPQGHLCVRANGFRRRDP